MAKILWGFGVKAVSGTFAGATFQSWRSLNIVRGKPVPHNPMTERQTRIRSIVSTISRYWRDVLNVGQRTAWEQFAEIFPWFDVFGKPLMLRGINLFLKMNTVLLDHDRAMQVTPPPAVEPPELTGLVSIEPDIALRLEVPQLEGGIITAQEPFIDVWVAGGFTAAQSTGPPEHYDLEILSSLLPQGRKHQKADFRHVAYADDVAVVEPPVTPSLISVFPVPGHTRNCVIRLQRYNRYGRYSVPVIYSGIRTGE